MKKGFTIIETTFVIVMIGILGSIAIPKLSSTVNLANNNNGLNTLVIVRGAIDRERQKRILRGDFTPITSLSAKGKPFDYFSPDGNDVKNPLLKYPVPSCDTSGCWELLNSSSIVKDSESYLYHYNDDDTCTFIFKNNRISGDCPALNSYI